MSTLQNAFVEGRKILDAALVVNEVVKFRRMQGVSGVLCKLDFEKAYDHVNWSFLNFIMIQMGFGGK